MRPLHADIPLLRWAVLALLPNLIKIKSHALLAWGRKHHTVSLLSRWKWYFIAYYTRLIWHSGLLCVCVCVCSVCESGYSKPLLKETLECHHLQA